MMDFSNTDDAIVQIIISCQKDFIEESEKSLQEIAEAMQQHTQNEMTALSLVIFIHKRVHGMKGVALTLYFEKLHHIFESILLEATALEASQESTLSIEHLLSLVEKMQVQFEVDKKIITER